MNIFKMIEGSTYDEEIYAYCYRCKKKGAIHKGVYNKIGSHVGFICKGCAILGAI